MPPQFHSHHIITCEKSHQSAAAVPPPPPPPGSRLQGECVLHFTADYSKYLSLFSKHSEMFHQLAMILGPKYKKQQQKIGLLLVFHVFILLSGFQQLGIGPTTPEAPAGSSPHAASVEVHLARPLAGCSSGLVFKVCSHNNKTIEPSTPIYRKELSSTSCPAHLSRIHRCLTAVHMAKMTRMIGTEIK